MNAGIYRITNLVNGRVYIGSTNKLSVRKYEHFRTLQNNNHCNTFLQRDYNKCSAENLVFETILETDCIELLLDFEQSYLDEYWDNGIQCYNVVKCASAFNRGRVVSQETKNKMSAAMKGRPKSEVHKQKMRGKRQPYNFSSTKRRKPIKSRNLVSGEEMTFESINDAAAYHNIIRECISSYLRGRTKTCKDRTLSFEYL